MTRNNSKNGFVASWLTSRNESGSVIAKREAVANEVKTVTALVEEMLGIAKQSYCAALTASHMGHIALEHSVTISQLRTRIFDLEDEKIGRASCRERVWIPV